MAKTAYSMARFLRPQSSDGIGPESEFVSKSLRRTRMSLAKTGPWAALRTMPANWSDFPAPSEWIRRGDSNRTPYTCKFTNEPKREPEEHRITHNHTSRPRFPISGGIDPVSLLETIALQRKPNERYERRMRRGENEQIFQLAQISKLGRDRTGERVRVHEQDLQLRQLTKLRRDGSRELIAVHVPEHETDEHKAITKKFSSKLTRPATGSGCRCAAESAPKADSRTGTESATGSAGQAPEGSTPKEHSCPNLCEHQQSNISGIDGKAKNK